MWLRRVARENKFTLNLTSAPSPFSSKDPNSVPRVDGGTYRKATVDFRAVLGSTKHLLDRVLAAVHLWLLIPKGQSQTVGGN